MCLDSATHFRRSFWCLGFGLLRLVFVFYTLLFLSSRLSSTVITSLWTGRRGAEHLVAMETIYFHRPTNRRVHRGFQGGGINMPILPRIRNLELRGDLRNLGLSSQRGSRSRPLCMIWPTPAHWTQYYCKTIMMFGGITSLNDVLFHFFASVT